MLTLSHVPLTPGRKRVRELGVSSSMIVFLDFFGIAVFAMSGALTAGQKRLDIFGVMVVALITCLGGGTLRDVILGAQPVVWVANTAYLYVGLGSALLAFVLARFWHLPLRSLEVCDAIGLAFFTLAGIQKAQMLGHGADIALLMGLMTGVAGGILRDVLCNEIPLIFHREIYATAALAGGGLFLLLQALAVDGGLALLLGMATILLLRLTGIFLGLSLPPFLFSYRRSG